MQTEGGVGDPRLQCFSRCQALCPHLQCSTEVGPGGAGLRGGGTGAKLKPPEGGNIRAHPGVWQADGGQCSPHNGLSLGHTALECPVSRHLTSAFGAGFTHLQPKDRPRTF